MAAQVFDRTNAVTPIVSVEERLRRAKAAFAPVEQLPPAKMAVQEIAPAPIVDEWAELDQDHFVEPKAEVTSPAPTKSLFRTIAEASIARGETRILPIKIGAKSPAKTWKGTAIDVLSTEDWLQYLPTYINEIDAEHADCNGCVIAKPDEFVYLDNDTTTEFRAGYEAFSGEKYPGTFTTSATENHSQEHFLQTDLTRAMGNVKQFKVDGIDLSVRQRNLYVLAEHSNHPKGGTYKAVVQADIVPMPDKMVAYIQYLSQKARDGKSTIQPGQTLTIEQVHENRPPINCEVDGPPIPFGEHDDTLHSIASALRARTSGDGGWEYEEIYERVVAVCETRCEGYLADYLDMCKKCAKQGCKYKKGFPSSKSVIMSQTEATRADQATQVEAIPTQPLTTEKTLGQAQEEIAKANEKLLDKLTPRQRKIFDGLHASMPELTYDAIIEQAINIDGLGTRQEAVWPDPAPFSKELLPVAAFELNFLPKSIQPWALDIHQRMSVPLDFVGVCMLTALAGCMNRRVFVYPRAHDKEWREPITLSGGAIAYSGSTKTPTWKAIINPLIEQDLDWIRKYKEDMKVYKIALKAFEKCRDGSMVEPVEPVCRRLMVNDATPEAMHSVMEDNPAGIFYYRDEFSGWVAELEKKDRESQRGLFLAAMNGNDNFTLDRIGRGLVTAIMSASLFGGFQPDMFIDFLNNNKNVQDGMIPRFGLLTWPDNVPFQNVDRVSDRNAKEVFKFIVRALANMKVEHIFAHFDSTAQAAFNEWLVKHEAGIVNEPNQGVMSHKHKYRGLLPKLAALYQVVDGVAYAPTVALGSGDGLGLHLPEGEVRIDLEHLERALGFLAYLEGHMRRAYGCIRTPLEKAEKSFADHLLEGGLRDGFSVRDVYRKLWKHLDNKDLVEAAIYSFQDRGWLRQLPVPEGKKGWPTIQWEINPKVKAKVK